MIAARLHAFDGSPTTSDVEPYRNRAVAILALVRDHDAATDGDKYAN